MNGRFFAVNVLALVAALGASGVQMATLIRTRSQLRARSSRSKPALTARRMPSAASYMDRLTLAVVVAVMAAAGCGRMPEPEPGQTRVAVMSFNVVHAKPPQELPWSVRLPAIGRMLDEKKPDIIGFQETLAEQVKDLADALDGYDWVGGGREDGNRSGELDPIFLRRICSSSSGTGFSG